MTDRLYAKYLWLINTVYEAGKISFEEIASKWNDTYINDLHQPLRLRTFHNHRNAILMQFGIIFECERGVNLYYIDNPEAIERDSINQWLLDSFSVNNTLLSNKNLKDRILLEDIPSGRTHLDTITDAMQNNRQLSICYEDFFGERCDNLLINPYCLKMFKRRWYVLAYVPSTNIIRRFGLKVINTLLIRHLSINVPHLVIYYARWGNISRHNLTIGSTILVLVFLDSLYIYAPALDLCF